MALSNCGPHGSRRYPNARASIGASFGSPEESNVRKSGNHASGSSYFSASATAPAFLDIGRVQLIENRKDAIALVLAAEYAGGGVEFSEVAFGGMASADFQRQFVADDEAIDVCFQAFFEFADFLPGDFGIVVQREPLLDTEKRPPRGIPRRVR